jgi:hypothetical protein
MLAEIALFWGFEGHFCHEKRPPKKKVPFRLWGTFRSCAAIFDDENGSLRLQNTHLENDIQWILIT